MSGKLDSMRGPYSLSRTSASPPHRSGLVKMASCGLSPAQAGGSSASGTASSWSTAWAGAAGASSAGPPSGCRPPCPSNFSVTSALRPRDVGLVLGGEAEEVVDGALDIVARAEAELPLGPRAVGHAQVAQEIEEGGRGGRDLRGPESAVEPPGH